MGFMRKRKNNKQPPREAELSADEVQFENIEDKKNLVVVSPDAGGMKRA